MKKTGIIITVTVLAVMVVAITIKLASTDDGGNSTTQSSTYEAQGEAGKLSDGMVGITSANYDETITNAKGVVVVDYFTPTCSYCIKYAPTYATVYEQYKSKAVFGKFDVSTDRTKIADLKITGTPTTIIFKDGQEVARLGGAVEESELKNKLDEVLAS